MNKLYYFIIIFTVILHVSKPATAVEVDSFSQCLGFTKEDLSKVKDNPVVDSARSLFFPWNLREDLKPALKRLLEAGPNTWIELNHEVSGQYLFQRGLSFGIFEAMNLLSGHGDPSSRCACFAADKALLETLQFNVNAAYSAPLSIRGRVDSFEDVSWVDPLTPERVASLQDLSPCNLLDERAFATQPVRDYWAECEDEECVVGSTPGYCRGERVGNRAGETQSLKPGNNINNVEAISTFITPPNLNARDDWQRGKMWGIQYIYLYETLMRHGIAPDQESIGYEFYLKLKEILADESFVPFLIEKQKKEAFAEGIKDYMDLCTFSRFSLEDENDAELLLCVAFFYLQIQDQLAESGIEMQEDNKAAQFYSWLKSVLGDISQSFPEDEEADASKRKGLFDLYGHYSEAWNHVLADS